MLTLTSETDKDYYYVITEAGAYISSGMVEQNSPTTVSTREGRVIETFDTEVEMNSRLTQLGVEPS